MNTLSPGATVVWPPVVVSVTALGYIRDVTGNYYPRDIGRSSQFSNGRIVWQFGDTFCHNLQKRFLGVSNNTCAVVPRPSHGLEDITATMYTKEYDQNNGLVSFTGEGLVMPLINKFEDEANTPTSRLKIWCFSGIVECSRQADEVIGYAFYEMRKDDQEKGLENEFQYTGIALITITDRTIFATRPRAIPRQLFVKDEPRIGTFCIIREGDFLYAYGHDQWETQVFLARVPISSAGERSRYNYWKGTSWSPYITEAAPVFLNLQHGQVFRTTMFGAESEFKYAFIGCSRFGDSTVQMGRAAKPQGPWEIYPLNDVICYVLSDAGITHEYCYCMYPHPWACDIRKGDLMVSWSEGGMTGGVLAAKVRLQTTETR